MKEETDPDLYAEDFFVANKFDVVRTAGSDSNRFKPRNDNADQKSTTILYLLMLM